MKCEPYPNSVLLRPETALEASALVRWLNSIASQRAELNPSNDHRYDLIIDFREPAPEKPPAPEPEPEPAPDWLAPGRWAWDGRSGLACQVLPWSDRRSVAVRFPGSCNPGDRRPGELEPWVPRVGDRVKVAHHPASPATVTAARDARVDRRFDVEHDDRARGRNVGLEDLEPWFDDPAPPEPAKRTVRVPAPGQRVKATLEPAGRTPRSFEGEVAAIRVGPDDVLVCVREAGVDTWAIPTGRVEPLSDDPRWIAIEIPEEVEA